MKHVPFAVVWIVIPMVVLRPMSVTAALGQQDAAGPGCAGIRSIECRAKAASTVQAAFSAKFPNIRVRAAGDVIVFADPKLFEKQEDRASYRSVIQSGGMEAQLCTFGFKKVRFESSVKPTSAAVPREEYDLRCSGTEEQPQSEAEAPKERVQTSPVGAAAPVSGLKGSPERRSSAEISGKIFLITKGGDLKSARLAQVILLYGSDEGTAATVYYNKKLENMKASYQSLVTPGDASCRAELLVFNSSLKSTLEWGQKNGKRDQIRIVESDEEGSFHFPEVQPGSYALVAWGRAGANDAYWEDDLKVEPGQNITAKLASPHTACLD
jgi:hypothetical protein